MSLTSFVLASVVTARAQDIAPTGTLRAAYLATNPAQAIRNAQTGEMRGASYDLATELAKRIGKPLDFKPIAQSAGGDRGGADRAGRYRLRRL